MWTLYIINKFDKKKKRSGKMVSRTKVRDSIKRGTGSETGSIMTVREE